MLAALRRRHSVAVFGAVIAVLANERFDTIDDVFTEIVLSPVGHGMNESLRGLSNVGPRRIDSAETALTSSERSVYR